MQRSEFLCAIMILFLIVVFYSNAPAQASDPNEGRIVVGTASGTTSYTKKDGVSKRNFSSIDVSQYAAAALNAEYTVSGTCQHITLVTSTNPSDEKNGLYRPPGLSNGETGIRELDVVIDGKLSRDKSSTLYITADIPFRGMALWYAADCTTSFKITVYALNAKKKCGPMPPIPPALARRIAQLKTTDSYKDRSKIYHEITEELEKRGIGIGFFEAASIVTDNLHYSPNLESAAQNFLDTLSKELAAMNADAATELLLTGKLGNTGKTRYFSEPTAIDGEMVRREQAYAETKLAASSDREKIVSAINKEINATLDGLLSQGFEKMNMYNSLAATRVIRDQKRKRERASDAKFDYGSLQERTGVGQVLVGRNRKKFLPNAVLCR